MSHDSDLPQDEERGVGIGERECDGGRWGMLLCNDTTHDGCGIGKREVVDLAYF